MRRLVLAAAAAVTFGLVFSVACSATDGGGSPADAGPQAGADAAAQAGADVDTSSVPPDAGGGTDSGSGDTGPAADTGGTVPDDAGGGADAGTCPIAASDPCLTALKADLDTAAQCFPHRNRCGDTPADPSGCGTYTDGTQTKCGWTDGASADLNDTQFTWDETTKSPSGTQCYRLQLSLFTQAGSLALASRTWDFTVDLTTFEVTFTCPAGGTLTLSPDDFEVCTGQPRPAQVCCSAAAPPACQ